MTTTLRLFPVAESLTILSIASALCYAGSVPKNSIESLASSRQVTAVSDADNDKLIHRIQEEAETNSQIVPVLTYLTEVIGPRLTGSAALKRANEWTRVKLRSWGMENAHLESWGPFPPGGWKLK